MIWLRRFGAIALGVTLFGVLFFALLIHRVDNTVLTARFYKTQLADAGFYEFALNDLASAAITNFTSTSLTGQNNSDDNWLTGFGVEPDEIVDTLNKAFTAEWVRAQTEASLDAAVPYLAGDVDEFEFTLNLHDQIEVLLLESGGLFSNPDIYDGVMSDFVEPPISTFLSDFLPLDLDIPTARQISLVRAVLTEDWAILVYRRSIEDVTPYLLGDADTFVVRIPVRDRADVALTEITILMDEFNAYQAFYDQILEPGIHETVGGSIDLGLGVQLTSEEIIDVLREVAPPEWVQLQFESVIETARPYILGEEDSFEKVIVLRDAKIRTVQAVRARTTAKIMATLMGLPRCENVSIIDVINAGGGIESIPGCLPGNVNLTELENFVSRESAAIVDPVILELIPDQVSFSERDIAELLGEIGETDSLIRIEEVREVIKNGLVITEADLIDGAIGSLLGDTDLLPMIERVRSVSANGITVSHVHVQNFARDSGSLGVLERARSTFGMFSWVPWVLYLVSAALAAGIGWLLGTGWRIRVMWASASASIVSITILVIWGPLFYLVGRQSVVESLNSTVDAMLPAGDALGIQALLATKAKEIIVSSLDAFVSGLVYWSLIASVIGLSVFLASVYWHDIRVFYDRWYPEVDARLNRATAYARGKLRLESR